MAGVGTSPYGETTRAGGDHQLAPGNPAGATERKSGLPKDSPIAPPFKPTRFVHLACLCRGRGGHVQALARQRGCRVSGRQDRYGRPDAETSQSLGDRRWWVQGPRGGEPTGAQEPLTRAPHVGGELGDEGGLARGTLTRKRVERLAEEWPKGDGALPADGRLNTIPAERRSRHAGAASDGGELPARTEHPSVVARSGRVPSRELALVHGKRRFPRNRAWAARARRARRRTVSIAVAWRRRCGRSRSRGVDLRALPGNDVDSDASTVTRECARSERTNVLEP